MDRAGPALAVVATLLRAGEVKHFAQAIEQRHPWIDSNRVVPAVHLQGDIEPSVIRIFGDRGFLCRIRHGLLLRRHPWLWMKYVWRGEAGGARLNLVQRANVSHPR